MEGIIRSIETGNWDKALHSFLKYSESHTPDEKTCILGASIMEHFMDYDAMFSFISTGLKLNPSNYELYLLLGNYFGSTNPDQAYLSYENALYYCSKIYGEDCEDATIIRQTINTLKNTQNVRVRNVSFVILSYNELDMTRKCIESIRSTCFDKCIEIVVVDNASSDGSVQWLQEQKDIVLIKNKENVGFPAGCNQGIMAASTDNDIFLLNNDTLLFSNSLLWLRIGLYNDEMTGATGAVTNNSSAEQVVDVSCSTIDEFSSFAAATNTPITNPYEQKIYLIMFAMLIKRECINTVGMLDELFTPGNFEDNDYGVRLTKNGYKCILCHNSFIFHHGSASFGKDVRKYNNLYITNSHKFRNKWGFSSKYCTEVRNDLVNLIDLPADAAFSVMEIGCGLGETLAKIKYRFPLSSICGLEHNKTIADIAGRRFNIVCTDILELSSRERYDYIIMADILELMKDPLSVLLKAKALLNDKGHLLVSIHNAMNADIIYDLLTDNTALKEPDQNETRCMYPFTIYTIRRMLEQAGFNISKLYTTSLPEKSRDSHRAFFDNITSISGVVSGELFDIYQFLIIAT